MTITDVRQFPQQCAAGHEDTGTPESQRLDELEEMLKNPDYFGFRAEIQASIDSLRATSALGA
jgi:hypothetical protein